MTAFPGTYLYDHRQQYGSISNDLSDYTYQGAAFVPYTMSKEEINKLRQIAFKRFYTRPSFLLKKLADIRTLNDCKIAVKSLKSLYMMWAHKNMF